jgi:hypothetical protein
MNEEATKIDEKKITADDVLIPKEKYSVVYGGTEYKISNLKLSQIILIIRTVSESAEKISSALKEEMKKKEGSLSIMEETMTILSALDEEQVYKIISVILEISEKTSKKDFSIVGVVSVLEKSLEIEDLNQIFFLLKSIKAKFAEMKEA